MDTAEEARGDGATACLQNAAQLVYLTLLERIA